LLQQAAQRSDSGTLSPANPGPARRDPRLGNNRPLTSIRGLAALWVIGSHVTLPTAEHWSPVLYAILRPGYMGVDVFFVLSGFILATVYQDLSPAGVARFFVKRIARLYPLNLAILAVLAGAVATGAVRLGSWATWPTLPWFVFMVEPYAPWPILSWNIATWSIGIELACYLCFPLVLMTIRRWPAIILSVLAVVLLGVALSVQTHNLGYWWGWRALLRGMGGFWPGVVLGCLALRLPEIDRRLAFAGEMLSVLGIGLAVAFDLRWVPICAGPLILCLYFDRGPVSWALRAGWCFWLGEVSFSIYLLHGLIMGQMGTLPWRFARHMPWGLAIVLYLALFMIVVLGLSQATYRLIEQPGRRLPELFARLLAGRAPNLPGPRPWRSPSNLS
jgi:peptidoglycan/LPS O-acetylase OafA/YrhL